MAGSNVWKKEVLVDMCHGRTWSNGEYREHFGVTAEEARSDLRDLVSRGLVTSTGERRWVRYELAAKAGPWCGVVPLGCGGVFLRLMTVSSSMTIMVWSLFHVKHSGVNGLVLVSFLVDGYFCSHYALEI